jgi:hypothetical protein
LAAEREEGYQEAGGQAAIRNKRSSRQNSQRKKKGTGLGAFFVCGGKLEVADAEIITEGEERKSTVVTET